MAPSPDTQAPQHAILLVHGVLGQASVYWNMMKKYLTTDRFHVHAMQLPFFGFGDLRKAAAAVAREVDHLLEEHPEEAGDGRVDVIGHSAGGLASRYYIDFLGGHKNVHHLITLGTPHHGTFTSHFFPMAKVARQTRPKSAFLRDLNKAFHGGNGVEYTCIYSRRDGVIVPGRSGRLEGARNIEVPTVTHWGYLWRPQVYEHIRRALEH